MVKNTEFITASEIGEYVFCKRGWWLRLNGYLEQSDVMREGTRLHDHIAWSVLLKKKIKMAILSHKRLMTECRFLENLENSRFSKMFGQTRNINLNFMAQTY